MDKLQRSFCMSSTAGVAALQEVRLMALIEQLKLQSAEAQRKLRAKVEAEHRTVQVQRTAHLALTTSEGRLVMSLFLPHDMSHST